MLWRERVGAGLVLLATIATGVAMGGIQKQEFIEAPAEEPVSVVNYIMASPRAFRMGAPIEGRDEPAVIGAAEDFPRTDGEIEVAVGTRVIFSLSQNTESVWQDATYGTIEAALTVQRFKAVRASDCDACAGENPSTGPVPPGMRTETGSPAEVAPCPWITIATDGARDTRTGPSLGYPKVGVPVEFTEPGALLCAWGREHLREVMVTSSAGSCRRAGYGPAGYRHGCRPGQGSRSGSTRPGDQAARTCNGGSGSDLPSADAQHEQHEGRSGGTTRVTG